MTKHDLGVLSAFFWLTVFTAGFMLLAMLQ
jgi:hypothetical protein